MKRAGCAEMRNSGSASVEWNGSLDSLAGVSEAEGAGEYLVAVSECLVRINQFQRRWISWFRDNRQIHR